MSSKKKMRRQKFLDRQIKKELEKLKQRDIYDAMNDPNGTIEELAIALNVPLEEKK